MKIKNRVIFLCLGLVVIAAMACFFAVDSPDGLEKIALEKGFAKNKQEKQVLVSPLPDYRLPWIKNERISALPAAAIGALSVFCLSMAIVTLSKSMRNKKSRIGNNGTRVY